MDKKDWYHGQTVLESDLDTAFDSVEDAERNLAIEADSAQATTTDTPDLTKFGGILEGLVVSRHGTDEYVDITAGIARDDSGRRIYLPTSATVSLTNIGTTDEDDVSLATGDGATVVTSCADGNNIVLSLWIAYDEVLSNPKVDGTGATVYYDISEGFSFSLSVGTDWNGAPAGAPDRASMANGKVLLADLVLLRTGSAMAVVAGGVCNSDQDWDDLGGNYALNTGRRSDWLALDQGSSFPRFADTDTSIRVGKARDAIHDLTEHLQRQTDAAGSPAGAKIIGSQALTGAGADSPVYSALTLTAGDLDAQLVELLDAINSKLSRGSDTLTPPASQHGLTLDPTSLDKNKGLLRVLANNGGSVGLSQMFDGHGLLRAGRWFYDDFFYSNGALNPHFLIDDFSGWGQVTGGGAGTITPISSGTNPGVIEITSNGLAGDSELIQLGGVDPNCSTWFTGSAGAGPACMVVFRLPTALTDRDCYMGLHVPGQAIGASGIYVHADGNATNLTLECWDSGLAATQSIPLLTGTLAFDTWYTVIFWVSAGGVLSGYVNGGSTVTTPALGGTGVFSATITPFLASKSKAAGGNAASILEVDLIQVADKAVRFSS